MPDQQGTQNHDPTFGGKHVWRGNVEFGEGKPRQAFKGKYLQPRVTGDVGIGQDLALDLEGRLFWGKKDQRPASRIVAQGGPNSGQTARGLAAASRSQEKFHAHD
jgi:hypothetical protein